MQHQSLAVARYTATLSDQMITADETSANCGLTAFTRETARMIANLPLIIHPAVTRVLSSFTPIGAG